VSILGATGVYLVSIRLLEWLRSPRTYTTEFTLWMLFAHVLVGLILVAPFLIFGCVHLITARTRKNRRAVKLGIGVFLRWPGKDGGEETFTNLAVDQTHTLKQGTGQKQ
jgi:hypothetical protein